MKTDAIVIEAFMLQFNEEHTCWQNYNRLQQMAEDNCMWTVGNSCNATEHMGVSSTDFEEPSELELVHGTQETGRR